MNKVIIYLEEESMEAQGERVQMVGREISQGKLFGAKWAVENVEVGELGKVIK